MTPLTVPLLGVKELDDQHIQMISFLQTAETVSTPADVACVESYIYDHLEAEERYMDAVKYPQAHLHKVIHSDIRSFIAFQLSRLPRLSLVDQQLFFSKCLLMLTEHLRGPDQKFSDWLRSNGLVLVDTSQDQTI